MPSVQCKRCLARFSRVDNMKRHQRNAHGLSNAASLSPPPSPTQASSPLPSSTPRTENFAFKHPFTANVSGPTSCGKTYFVKFLLQNCTAKISPPPERILWLYKRWQPLYDVIKDTVKPKVEFIQGIPLDLECDSCIHPSTRNLVILDDLMSMAAKDSRVNELFTEGSHHRNLSVIAINQNLYFNKDPTQRRNCHYLVMFNNPIDQQQIMTLARQMYPGNPQHLMRHFRVATSKPYGYLLVDLKPTTQEDVRMRTNIFDVIRREPSQGFDSRVGKASTPIKTEEMSFCDDCGLVFENIHSLQKHVKSWCQELNKRKRGDDESMSESPKRPKLDDVPGECMRFDPEDSMDSNYESEEKMVFNDLMDKARTDNETEWEQKYEKYRKDGMSKEEANRKAEDKMLEKDMKHFNQEYGLVIKYILQLQRGQVHEKVMDDVKDFLDDGNDRQKSIKLALYKNRYHFDEMWGTINDMLDEKTPNDETEKSDAEE